MKKAAIIILSVAALVAGLVVFFQSSPAVQTTPPPNNQQSSASRRWETKTDDRADVNVVVAPVDLSPQSAEWKFDIGMNTHSVELDQDMTQSAVLVDDNNTEYKPTKWDGPTGGHHREGILSFTPTGPYPQYLTLKLNGIGGADRSFSWSLYQ